MLLTNEILKVYKKKYSQLTLPFLMWASNYYFRFGLNEKAILSTKLNASSFLEEHWCSYIEWYKFNSFTLMWLWTCVTEYFKAQIVFSSFSLNILYCLLKSERLWSISHHISSFIIHRLFNAIRDDIEIFGCTQWYLSVKYYDNEHYEWVWSVDNDNK